jgi:hypothetical protein
MVGGTCSNKYSLAFSIEYQMTSHATLIFSLRNSSLLSSIADAAILDLTPSHCHSTGPLSLSFLSFVSFKIQNLTMTSTTAAAPTSGYFFVDHKDSIAPEILQYLGVRSLVAFSACRKSYRELFLLPEVARRKTIFAKYEEQYNLLLQTPNRGNVLKARSLLQCARDLVDAEMGWCDNDSTMWAEDDEEQNDAIMRQSPFFEQIQRLSGPPSRRPPFFMLPLCF